MTNTLPQEEIDAYFGKILDALKIGGFEKMAENRYLSKSGTEVIINFYDNHPKNTAEFPENYKSLDIVVCSKGYDYAEIQNRMWNLSKKMYRMPDKRGNPTYVNDMKEILPYLPAQVEMGCGPSINANIPPLYEMHETYKVQNHITGKFYFADQDTLLFDVISNENEMRKKFKIF